MYFLQKIFLVAILVSICAAKCTNGVIGTVGSVPCPIITPGFGTPGLGGGAGGFPGLNGEYISKSFQLKFGLFERQKLYLFMERLVKKCGKRISIIIVQKIFFNQIFTEYKENKLLVDSKF